MDRLERLWAWFLSTGQRIPLFVPEEDQIEFYNDSGEDIPPHAVMQITDGEESVVKVDKPADRYGRTGPYLINGNEAVLEGKFGIATKNGTALVKIVDAGTVNFGKRLSAEANQWYAIENPCGPWRYCGTQEELSYNGTHVLAQWVDYPPIVDFVAPVGGIAATTGTDPLTMGSATCDIWIDSGTLGQLTDSSFNETIYNRFAESVPASARGIASLSGRGVWRAVSWSC
jgi:hypothetical protein